MNNSNASSERPGIRIKQLQTLKQKTNFIQNNPKFFSSQQQSSLFLDPIIEYPPQNLQNNNPIKNNNRSRRRIFDQNKSRSRSVSKSPANSRLKISSVFEQGNENHNNRINNRVNINDNGLYYLQQEEIKRLRSELNVKNSNVLKLQNRIQQIQFEMFEKEEQKKKKQIQNDKLKLKISELHQDILVKNMQIQILKQENQKLKTKKIPDHNRFNQQRIRSQTQHILSYQNIQQILQSATINHQYRHVPPSNHFTKNPISKTPSPITFLQKQLQFSDHIHNLNSHDHEQNPFLKYNNKKIINNTYNTDMINTSFGQSNPPLIKMPNNINNINIVNHQLNSEVKPANFNKLYNVKREDKQQRSSAEYLSPLDINMGVTNDKNLKKGNNIFGLMNNSKFIEDSQQFRFDSVRSQEDLEQFLGI